MKNICVRYVAIALAVVLALPSQALASGFIGGGGSSGGTFGTITGGTAHAVPIEQGGALAPNALVLSANQVLFGQAGADPIGTTTPQFTALGINGAAGSTGTIAFGTGGGSVTQVLGPTDADLTITAGGAAFSRTLWLKGGTGGAVGGGLQLAGGPGVSNVGGDVVITGGAPATNFGGGNITLQGASGNTAGSGGSVTIAGGQGAAAAGGGISIAGGVGSGSNKASGGLVFDMGSSSGNATEAIVFKGPPTGGSGSGANASIALWSLGNTGTLAPQTGLGAITHIIGPTDQPLQILAASTKALNLGGNAATQWQITSGGVLAVQTGLGAITHIMGASDQNFVLSTTNSRGVVSGPNLAAATIAASMGGNFASLPGTFAIGAPFGYSSVSGLAVAGLVDTTAGTGQGTGGGVAFGLGNATVNFWLTNIRAYKEDAVSNHAQSSIVFSSTNQGLTSVTDWLTLDASGFLRETSGGVFGWTSSATNSKITTALDTGVSRISANITGLGNGTAGDFSGTLKCTSAFLNGKITTYNGITTSGYGVPVIVSSNRNTAKTSADANVCSYANGAADATFEIAGEVEITTLGSGNFTMTVSYTDPASNVRTTTLPLCGTSGTVGTICAAASVFQGVPIQIRVKASTSITVATTGTFTSCTYNDQAVIKQEM